MASTDLIAAHEMTTLSWSYTMPPSTQHYSYPILPNGGDAQAQEILHLIENIASPNQNQKTASFNSQPTPAPGNDATS